MREYNLHLADYIFFLKTSDLIRFIISTHKYNCAHITKRTHQRFKCEKATATFTRKLNYYHYTMLCTCLWMWNGKCKMIDVNKKKNYVFRLAIIVCGFTYGCMQAFVGLQLCLFVYFYTNAGSGARARIMTLMLAYALFFYIIFFFAN